MGLRQKIFKIYWKMDDQRHPLNLYTGELLASLDTMRRAKEEMAEELCRDEEERDKISAQLEKFKERLNYVNDYLDRAKTDRVNVERTIYEAELTKDKINEGMRTLLHSIQQEDSIKAMNY